MDEAEAEVFVIYDDNCNWNQCQFYCPSVQGQWLQLLSYGSNNNVNVSLCFFMADWADCMVSLAC